MSRLVFPSAAAALVAVAACGGGESSAQQAQPSPPPAIAEVRADLRDFVTGELQYVAPYSEGYAIPSSTELAAFDALAADLVAGNLEALRAAAGALDYALIRLVDTGAGGNELYCLRETALRGRGFFCADYDAAKTHHVSVPHPLFDGNTNTESATVMRETGARFLSISTTHRCANAAESACSGTTTACGAPGPYKVSDPAHNADNFFTRFGIAVHDASPATYTIQLHGCGSAACPANRDPADIVARISAGTTDDLPETEAVNRLQASLNEALAPFGLGSALSCSRPGVDKQLCGTTNVLGRYINGQPDSCRNSATEFSGSRWLHVEQNANLRGNEGDGDELTPRTIAAAINDAL